MEKIRFLTTRPHRLLPPLLREIKENYLKRQPVLVLVPQQMTVTAEEMLMNRLGLDCLMGIDVASPTKLYDTLMHFLGRDQHEPLTDMGYRMAIGQTLENMDGKLNYFRKSNRMRGMVEKLAPLIMDMKRGGLSSEKLLKLAQEGKNDLQRAKFTDLAGILQRYEALLEGRFYDSEDRMGYLGSRMGECTYMNGKFLYIYGFDMITEQLSRLILAAAKQCEAVTVALECDGGGGLQNTQGDSLLFEPIRGSIARLKQAAAARGIACESIQPERLPLSAAAEMVHLDENLFVPFPKCFQGENHAIRLSASLNPYEEASLMSRRVLSCMKNGVSLEKMFVLMPDSSEYDFAVSCALRDAGIPCFSNRSMKAAGHNLVQFLLMALRAMESRWSRDTMLPLLQSPYVPLVWEEACKLRDYAVAYGIAREKWEQPFTRGDNGEAEFCEVLRQQLMEPLQCCREALLTARDARDSAAAVYRFLLDTDGYSRLRTEVEELNRRGMASRADQCAQVWDSLMAMLDDAIRLEGDHRIPLKHIANRFENALSAVNLSTLPPANAVLQTGNLGHMLVQEADVVFIMGMNEGILSRSSGSLLGEEDRHFAMDSSGCFLGLSDMSLNTLAKLDLKKAMTLPKKQLYISWSETNMAGEKLEPSGEILYMNQSEFEGKLPLSGDEEELPLSARQAEMRLTAMQPGDEALSTPEWQKITAALREDAAHAQLGSVLHHSLQPISLTGEEAEKLYGNRMSVSVLEDYAWCKFSHFITWGLRPKENKTWEIDSRLKGTFCHSAMEAFGRSAAQDPDYPRIPPLKLQKMTQAALNRAEEVLSEEVLRDGARNQARLMRLHNAVKRSVEQVTRQLAQGSFRLERTETVFGETGKDSLPALRLKLPNGETIRLKGKIDRIDSLVSNGESYKQVIDYKSSSQKLDAGKILLGVQLQLLLYQSVCEEVMGGTVPAGALYFHIHDPYVDSAVDDSVKKDGDLAKQFFMSGIVLDVAEDFAAKEGDKPPYQSTQTVNREDMELLLRYTRHISGVLAQQMLDGSIEIDPASFGDVNACQYCKGNEICKRDRDDDRFRRPPDQKFKDLLESLRQGNLE